MTIDQKTNIVCSKYIRAFTLIELLITISIFTIIGTIAAPHISRAQAQQESKSIYPYLYQVIQYHKQNAILKQQNIILCSSDNGEDCNGSNLWNKGILAIHDHNKNGRADSTDPRLNFHSNNINHGTLKWNGSRQAPIIVLQSDTGLPRGSIGNFSYCSHKYNDQFSHKSILGMMGHLRSERLTTC